MNIKEPIMDDLAPLEKFSALDDWLPEAQPLWKPFRPLAARDRRIDNIDTVRREVAAWADSARSA
jgi:hypothetical protein